MINKRDEEMKEDKVEQKVEKKEESYLTSIQITIIKTLKKYGDLMRGKENDRRQETLVFRMRTPRSTIYDNLVTLEKLKIVERYEMFDGRRGRPPKYWKLIKSGEKFL